MSCTSSLSRRLASCWQTFIETHKVREGEREREREREIKGCSQSHSHTLTHTHTLTLTLTQTHKHAHPTYDCLTSSRGFSEGGPAFHSPHPVHDTGSTCDSAGPATTAPQQQTNQGAPCACSCETTATAAAAATPFHPYAHPPSRPLFHPHLCHPCSPSSCCSCLQLKRYRTTHTLSSLLDGWSFLQILASTMAVISSILHMADYEHTYIFAGFTIFMLWTQVRLCA